MLEVLAEHEVPATFFMVGRRAEARPDIVRRVAAAGHTVASHAYVHRDLVKETASRIKREIPELLTQGDLLRNPCPKPDDYFCRYRS